MLLVQASESADALILSEDIVKSESSALSNDIGYAARCECNVRESIINCEQELGGFAVLELSHQLNTSVLKVSGKLTTVELSVCVLAYIKSKDNFVGGFAACLVALRSPIILVILKSKA